MTISSIKRIGIVLKPNQPDALKTMCEQATWLAGRGIGLLGGPEIERERIEQAAFPLAQEEDRQERRDNDQHREEQRPGHGRGGPNDGPSLLGGAQSAASR